MQEFSLIKKYFVPLSSTHQDCLALQDDAYLLDISKYAKNNYDIIMSMDSLREGTHFFGDESPENIAEKALAVNISDLVAKGANIFGYFLSIICPKKQNEDFIRRFCMQLASLQKKYQCHLCGGDTIIAGDTLTITIHAMGYIPVNEAVRRHTAQTGDDIWITGYLGDSAIGLDFLKQDKTHDNYFTNKYYRPCPRHDMIDYIRQYAHSAMDISDGLIGDITHITNASHVGAEIYYDAIPKNPLSKNLYDDDQLLNFIMAGGDDYEILMTASPHDYDNIMNLNTILNYQITAIGKIIKHHGIKVFDNHIEKNDISHKIYKTAWQYHL